MLFISQAVLLVSSVRYVCSASLHLLQGQILSDMEDPAVLQLLWCLLEADGEKLSEAQERAPMPYDLAKNLNGSEAKISLYDPVFAHKGSSFTPSWLSLTCDVDNRFQVSFESIRLS